MVSLLGLLLAGVAFIFGVEILIETCLVWVFGARLSVGDHRIDGARRGATDHDRDHGRIYRKDPVRAQSPAGLFRGRAHSQDRRAPGSRRRSIDALGGRVGYTKGNADRYKADLRLPGKQEGRKPSAHLAVRGRLRNFTGVNTAIRDLAVRGRLNATSVMAVAPSFHRSEASSLAAINTSSSRVAIGLHLTLTAPFRPLSESFKPVSNARFLTLAATLRHAAMRRFGHDALKAEITAQIGVFVDAFGRAPDFIDGHQHVDLFPQISEAVLEAMQALALTHGCGNAAASFRCRRDLPTARVSCSTF